MLDPPVFGVAVIAAVSGFAVAALLPAANGLFVQALPDEMRARAFGVMQSGIQLSQGGAVFLTGALASRMRLPLVVGLWGVSGVVLMLLASLTWPRREAITTEINRARRDNAEAYRPAHGAPVVNGDESSDVPSADSAARSAETPAPRDDDDPPRSAGGRHRLRTASG
jgi:MFS family permease